MSPGILPRWDPVDGIRPAGQKKQTFSDIMISRYGIPAEDVQRYKKDHRLVVAIAVFSGMILGLGVAAILVGLLYWDFPILDVETLLVQMCVWAFIFALGTFVLEHFFRKGAQA